MYACGPIVATSAENEGGGKCGQCGRILGCKRVLEEHPEYCNYFLSKKNEALQAGFPEEEPLDDEYWLDGGEREYQVRLYADMCLSYLNQQDPSRVYKLVKPGNYSAMKIATGLVFHFNFKAKANNRPVETFFVQFMGYPDAPPKVEFCLSLGFSEDLPPWDSPYLSSCIVCHCAGIHHPSPDTEPSYGGRLILGDLNSGQFN